MDASTCIPSVTAESATSPNVTRRIDSLARISIGRFLFSLRRGEGQTEKIANQ